MSLCSYKLRPIPRAIPLVLIVCGTIYHDPITTNNRDYSTKDMCLVRRMIAIEDQQDFPKENVATITSRIHLYLRYAVGDEYFLAIRITLYPRECDRGIKCTIRFANIIRPYLIHYSDNNKVSHNFNRDKLIVLRGVTCDFT